MNADPARSRSGRGKRVAAAAAVGLLVAGMSAGLAFALVGRSSAYAPARPLTLAEKRTIEAELAAASVARREHRESAVWAHGRRATALTRAHGQAAIAAQIAAFLVPGGCQWGNAALTDIHISKALQLLRDSPTAPA